MGFITQNANLLLLFLIVFASAGLVASAVYFSMTFDKLNDRYEAKKNQLNTLMEDVQKSNQTLQAIKKELLTKASREQEISGKFGEVKNESEKFKAQTAELTRTKEKLEADLDNFNRLNQRLQVQVGDLTRQNDIARQNIAARDGEILTLRREIDKLRTQLSSLLK